MIELPAEIALNINANKPEQKDAEMAHTDTNTSNKAANNLTDNNVKTSIEESEHKMNFVLPNNEELIDECIIKLLQWKKAQELSLLLDCSKNILDLIHSFSLQKN